MYREVSINACKDLILAHHYSGRLPGAIKLCYADVEENAVVACCLFSSATGRWETENLWELTRLVRLPSYEAPLTKLVSKSLGYIRKGKLTDLIISFADAEEDHHGGIYQACSWIYDGVAESRLDGFNVGGVFVPARTCNTRYGTSSVEGMLKKVPGSVPHFDSTKHRYWKPMNKAGMLTAIRIGLGSQGYPKPALSGSTPLIDPQLRKGRVNVEEGSEAGGKVLEAPRASRVVVGHSAIKNPAKG